MQKIKLKIGALLVKKNKRVFNSTKNAVKYQAKGALHILRKTWSLNIKELNHFIM